MKLSRHFYASEFKCPCCGKVVANRRLVQALEQLRARCGGMPVTVTSGYRCADRNEFVGGVDDSQHLRGNAADIQVARHTPEQVVAIAKTIPAFREGGIGEYIDFVHVDVRRWVARW